MSSWAIYKKQGLEKRFTINILKIVRDHVKDQFSGLRQFLATESALKMMKKDLCFTSKAIFVLKIFRFLSWLFGHIPEQLDKKDKVNFKFYDATVWFTSNRNTHIAQYFEK